MAKKFSKSQKLAAALTQDVPLEGMDADHVKPLAHGGETSVENLRMILPETNRAKGSQHVELWDWQNRFVEAWKRRESGLPFLMVVIPGGGKTWAALHVAREWLGMGADRQLIIVVPSLNLRDQWQDEAVKFGLELQTKEFGTRFKQGFSGAVVTYQSVVSQQPLLRKLCSNAPTLAIFDEIHHCGDEAAFGTSVVEAFGLAKERLLLSGTPWRTEGQPIPFVRYDGNGFPLPDFRYDYPEALNDDIVRHLAFPAHIAHIHYEESGRTEEFNQEISDDEASQRLRKVLSPRGHFVREQIRLAHRKLMELRRTFADAGGLAACIDQNHALQIAAVIKEETGCTPSVIISDEDNTNDSVDAFRKSGKEWLVSVRKISEGVDIKRLQVLCYFTNWVTEVFFRQLIGRVSRRRRNPDPDGPDDIEAYVYLPADPRLIRFAENIQEAQLRALQEQREREDRLLEEREPQDVLLPEPFTTQHGGVDVVLIGNRRYSPADAQAIEKTAEATGLSMDAAAKCLEIFRAQGVLSAAQPAQSPTETPLEKRLDELRYACSQAAKRFALTFHRDFDEVNGAFPKHAIATEDQLRQKLRTLKQWERQGGMP